MTAALLLEGRTPDASGLSLGIGESAAVPACQDFEELFSGLLRETHAGPEDDGARAGQQAPAGAIVESTAGALASTQYLLGSIGVLPATAGRLVSPEITQSMIPTTDAARRIQPAVLAAELAPAADGRALIAQPHEQAASSGADARKETVGPARTEGAVEELFTAKKMEEAAAVPASSQSEAAVAAKSGSQDAGDASIAEAAKRPWQQMEGSSSRADRPEPAARAQAGPQLEQAAGPPNPAASTESQRGESGRPAAGTGVLREMRPTASVLGPAPRQDEVHRPSLPITPIAAEEQVTNSPGQAEAALVRAQAAAEAASANDERPRRSEVSSRPSEPNADRGIPWTLQSDRVSGGALALEHPAAGTRVVPSERADAPRIVDQVIRAAKTRLFEGGGSVAIKLDPPHLGTVRMNITSTGGVITAAIETSTEAARQILEADVANLKLTLAHSGVNVDSINVSIGGGSQESWREQSAAAWQWTESQGNPNWFWGRNPSAEAAVPGSEPQTDRLASPGFISGGAIDYLA